MSATGFILTLNTSRSRAMAELTFIVPNAMLQSHSLDLVFTFITMKSNTPAAEMDYTWSETTMICGTITLPTMGETGSTIHICQVVVHGRTVSQSLSAITVQFARTYSSTIPTSIL